MPRIARVIVPNYPHHVVQRGTNGERIFCDDRDRIFFLSNLKKLLHKTKVKILAYCLMINHFHLLLIPPDKNSLSKCIHGLTFIHAQVFNSKYDRKGRLWQNRYFSCPVDFGEHLWTVARYIERNPVRAKLIQKPDEWKWSSARFHIHGVRDKFEETLSELFEEKDRKEYSIFLGVEGGEEEVRKATSTGRPFGDLSFYERLEKLLGRNLLPKKGGRPRKNVILEEEFKKNMGVVPSF